MKQSPVLARITERAYRLCRRPSDIFLAADALVLGPARRTPDYFLTRWIFLRALGVIYLVAFVSLLDANQRTDRTQRHPANRPLSCPPSNNNATPKASAWNDFTCCRRCAGSIHPIGFLNLQCAAGTACAILLIVGIAPVPCLTLLWLLYLSLVTVGRDFLGFQWDNLLLEAGFLAIFFAPLQRLPRPSRESARRHESPSGCCDCCCSSSCSRPAA